MRLIDADELRWTNLQDGFGRINTCIVFESDINAMPTIDAVPVVRCRECKYLRLTGKVWRCVNEIVGMICEPNDYCSRGERK